MGLLDSIKANTIGVVYRAFTGNVDPWTVANIKEETAAGIAKAGSGISPEAQQAQIAAANRQIDAVLNANDANPNNPDGSLKSSLRIPGLGVVSSPEFLKNLEVVVYAGLGLLALGGVTYFFAQWAKIKRGFLE